MSSGYIALNSIECDTTNQQHQYQQLDSKTCDKVTVYQNLQTEKSEESHSAQTGYYTTPSVGIQHPQEHSWNTTTQKSAESWNKKPSNHIIVSLVSLFACFCCWPASPCAILAVIYAMQVCI